MANDDVEVADNRSAQRFEARLDGELAGFAEYRLDGAVYTFTHTEVDDSFEGRGVGGALVRSSLDAVRAAGGSVVAKCPFVASFIEEHDEYADLVETD